MEFNAHRNLVGQHAFLSASKYHWLNYDEQKMLAVWRNSEAAKRGTELHDFAATAIKLRRRQPKTKDTICMFVNDALGFHMTPEQPLYYSPRCFGTADAISFEKKTLRIHDLKTGENPASMHQLEIYAALFCLEYGVNPEDIQIVLRLYQSNDIIEGAPDAEIIRTVMDKIITFDNLLEKAEEEEI